MKWIDAEQKLNIAIFDEQTDDCKIETMTIEEILDAYTDEGCPEDYYEGDWILCSEKLPEKEYPVIVTWKNDDPKSYYQYILGKHYTGIAHYKNGKWFWYSSVTEDVLMEYGRYDSEEFDEAIKVLAWMPLPEPYGGEWNDRS